MIVTTDMEKVTLALNTQDSNILFDLMNDVSSRVRRAVAKNSFSPKEILNILIDDPVLNVSYIASTHKNCTAKKEFSEDIKHPCVCCNVKEDIMDCTKCSKPQRFRTK